MKRRHTYPTLFICLLLAFLIFPALIYPAAASGAPRPDSLEIGIHYTENVGSNGFHAFWRHGRGAGVFVAMPVHSVDVQGGVRALSFGRKPDGVPGFHSFFVYLGLGKKWTLTPWLGLYSGIDVGSEQMLFDVGVEGGNSLESEFAVNIGARLIPALRDGWALNVSGNYEVFFTHKPIRLFVITVGVSRSFSTPGWVKEFLR
jgi:hypothetical protein